MVSCALLYNFTGKKAEMTKMVCMMMNIRFKSVGQEDYHAGRIVRYGRCAAEGSESR